MKILKMVLQVYCTHSLGINDVNYSAYFSFVLSVVDQDYTANFNKSSEGLMNMIMTAMKRNM